MAGQKLSPRQKMINMLYLVLLALLALNVSAEVLRAFAFVNDGLEQTTRNFEQKNELLYENFRAQLEHDREAVLPNYNRANEVKERADELVRIIEEHKDELIKRGGGKLDDGQIRAADNLDIASHYMISLGNGSDLQEKILDTRKFFYEQLEGIITEEELDLSINAEDPPLRDDQVTASWENQLFYYAPLAAAVTNLSKLQNDVRNSEADVVDRLLRAVYAGHFQFDQLSAQVIPNTNYVMIGEEFKADIFLSAFSTTQAPTIFVDGEPVEEISDGKGTFRLRPTREGEHSFRGYIEVADPAGGSEMDSFEINFQAFQPAAIISADAMNLMYVGLANPISVSVPGYPTDRVEARISRGNLRKKADGKYDVTLTDAILQNPPRETVISAWVRTDAGETRKMGEQTYRVRPLPTPEAIVTGGHTEGEISRGAAQMINRIIVRLGEGFAFEGINFDVVSYRFIHEPRRGDPFNQTGRGAQLNPQMVNRFQNAASGDVFIITDIRAEGPDGTVPTRGITLTIR